ncbi:MAG TPA: universal stress protein [Thermoplasmata archaeon]|jgi:nucleotide-binding universal stress UspA family protein|nr:universal stress protein [Thermoplasmata archaeon]
MYHQVLVPVQRASEVEPMLRFASMILDADGEIRLLHVIPTTTLPEVTREWRASVNIVVPAHEAGAALDVRVEPEVRAATDVPGEILESAESHNVDAILLTLSGSRRSSRFFVGHTATGILQHSRSDVLVLNRLALATPKIPRILVSTFRDQPSPKAMMLAEEIAVKNPPASVVALTLSSREESEAGADEEREETSTRGIRIVHHLSVFSESMLGRRRRLPDLLLQAAARERYGFLLVSEEEHGGSALLTRRFLEELFRAAPCPILAVRT